AEQLLTVERDRSGCHRVVPPTHQHVRQRRLATAVRTHQRVHFTGAHLEVDAPQDLEVANRRVQSLHPQHRRRRRPHCPPSGSVTITSSPSTRTGYTGTGVVAGSDCGSPVSSENVDPCFGHSISSSSAHTS